MPIYDYTCGSCGAVVEVLVPYAERDKRVLHCSVSDASCKGEMTRNGVTPVRGMGDGMGDTRLDGRHQTKAIIVDGDKKVGYVDGHFGKSAKKR